MPITDTATPPRWITWLAAGTALFHIWANTLGGNLSELWRNSLHWGLLGFLGFLLYTGLKNRPAPRALSHVNRLGAALVLSCSLYLIFFEQALHDRNELPIWADLVFAALAVLLTLELARRTSGYIIPALGLVLLTYVLWWGKLLSGVFSFRGMTMTRVLYRMFFTDEGLFGMIASISSTYVFMFVLFAAFLLASGGGEFIIRLARVLTRRLAAGPGLVAVLASGLMGTISGSAVANTVSTGAITIPLMKQAGYSPRFAAAVESAASTGGQLMPPIMGAGAFIMAQWTQIPYGTIIAAALLPALLYFASVGFHVVLEGRKRRAEMAPLEVDSSGGGNLVRQGAVFFVPILVLIGVLIAGFTPTYAAGIAILAVVAVSWFSPTHRMTPARIIEALALGTRNMIPTGILLVAAGIVVGIINMTGISITFSQLVVEWSGMHLFPALMLVAGASLLLGMGLPVTAAYIMIAILTVPALTEMGVPLLAAHMVIFWFSQDSNVTPPVCLASYAASSIAGSRPMATGFTSWRLSKALYIMPVLFAYTGLISGGWGERIIVFVFSLVGLLAFTVVFTGYLIRPVPLWLRLMFLLCAAALFWPAGLVLKAAGLGLMCLGTALNLKQRSDTRDNHG
jgi:TRAP transporter 4TM/12TM fusion protein